MTNEFDHIQYSPIRNYRYVQWFQEVKYSGKSLTEAERKEFLAASDEIIASYSKGLPLIASQLERYKNMHGEYYEIYRTLLSVMLFTLLIVIDSIVACKLFIMADKDYDRRFLRGKMKIILNEGFKKLYGFKEGKKESEWNRLAAILKYFPEKIKRQYQELSSLLEEQSISSSWWKEERSLETHPSAEKLYASRCEDVVESKVMTDAMKLINALFAVYAFLTNMNACCRNFLVKNIVMLSRERNNLNT